MTREESIKYFEQQQKRYKQEHDGTECPHYTNAIKALQEPERVHGHWIKFYAETEDRHTQVRYQCPRCMRAIDLLENFCPICGVIMDEVKE